MGTLDVVYRLLGVNETLDKMCDDVRDAMLALESERDAAVRRAAAAESALASARVEGAREFVARYVSCYADPEMPDAVFRHLRHLRAFRDREYPAAAPVPETRPAVAPEPPQRVTRLLPFGLRVQALDHGEMEVVITQEAARRIVSLAAQDGGSDA